ncbi:carbohydrate kinase family protein [Actinomadura darangshiensis]|uniref:Carbohydrate kinase family protein n=1 Tax=Actinomadura darangshiensis TaxID=705336 RepID=A0A4R5ABP5_9ACTN|nr:carbohydrate kinase family protein [Actinomadura darangshiensis]TDD68409.1 carbohydrate kinase family protein [Actinomadura darangshiensis]
MTAMPRLNYGVDVEYTEGFVAGDGPLVAASLQGLGHPASLHSNPVADDDVGRSVHARLTDWNITLHPSATPMERTRTNIVVVDHSGNRTWFSGLRGITDELRAIDLPRLTVAPVVYLDCYEVLQEAPRAVMAAALEAGCQVIVNLGGSPPPAWLAETLRGRRIRALQTNAEENTASAHATLEALCALDVAELTVVTVGRYGAIGHAHAGQNAVRFPP